MPKSSVQTGEKMENSTETTVVVNHIRGMEKGEGFQYGVPKVVVLGKNTNDSISILIENNVYDNGEVSPEYARYLQDKNAGKEIYNRHDDGTLRG